MTRSHPPAIALAWTVALFLALVAPEARGQTLADVVSGPADEAAADEGAAGGGKSPAPAVSAGPEATPEDPLGRDTPRGAVRGYLEAARDGEYARAGHYLDLEGTAAEQGSVRARQLKVVLDQTLWIDLDLLSGEPAGKTGDGLPANREEVGEVPSKRGPVPILLERVKSSDGRPVWKFSSATVARIPDLYEQHGYGPLGHYLPQIFFDLRFLELALWQWVGLLALVLIAGIAAWALASLALSLLHPLLKRTTTHVDDRLADLLTGPLRLALGVLTFSAGTLFLGLSIPARAVLSAIESAFVVVAATWAALRLVDLFSEVISSRLRQRNQAQAISLLPPGRKTLKTIIVAIAVVAAIESFGYDATALLAGLGVGGIAVALAAQKSLEHLFGGVTLYAARPVRVGDFCRFGDKVGTVEDIGLRTTRVRTLDRTVVHVPNAEFANLQLENFAARDKIWYHPTIGLRYETTPDQIRYILVEVRKMLYSHPRVDPDPARIRFTRFSAYSLDLEIFAYVRSTDFGQYLEIAEDLNLRIMDIVEAAGSGFAFPSQTTYLEQGSGLDAERSKAAEESVRQWREQQELYLPRFPQEKVSELSGSLPYPPPGAPRLDGA